MWLVTFKKGACRMVQGRSYNWLTNVFSSSTVSWFWDFPPPERYLLTKIYTQNCINLKLLKMQELQIVLHNRGSNKHTSSVSCHWGVVGPLRYTYLHSGWLDAGDIAGQSRGTSSSLLLLSRNEAPPNLIIKNKTKLIILDTKKNKSIQIPRIPA